jgi:hypothetical protein
MVHRYGTRYARTMDMAVQAMWGRTTPMKQPPKPDTPQPSMDRQEERQRQLQLQQPR